MKLSLRVVRFLLTAGLVALTVPASARPGDLDFRFNLAGSGSAPGTVRLSIQGVHTLLKDLAVMPDGKILTMGMAGSDLALSRWLPDGSLDPAFGVGGIVRTLPDFADSMQAMALQPDGRIVVAGSPFRAVRFMADGSLDSSFGTGGIKILPLFDGSTASVVVLSDGKILGAGVIRTGPPVAARPRPRLWRVLPNGSEDHSFGHGGAVTLPVDGATLREIAVQPDGKIVMAGSMSLNGPLRAWLARCDAYGALDASFGDAGNVLAPLLPGGLTTQAERLVLQGDGKIVIAGVINSGAADHRIFLARYTHDGSPDSTFGVGGSVITNVISGPDHAPPLSIQPDGKLVVAGSANNKLVLARYLPDGVPDDSFGTGGVALPGVLSGLSSSNAMALQPDGGIVAGGTLFDIPSATNQLVLVRCMDREVPGTLSGEWPAGTVLRDGGTVDLGTVPQSDRSRPEATITLRNTGNASLINPVATLFGADCFSLTSALPPVLHSGAAATVTVRFIPPFQVSDFVASLVVASDDPDLPAFGVFVHGTTVPAVAVLSLFDGSLPLAQNAKVNFGSTFASRPVTRVLTIRNTGSIALLLQGISMGTAGTPGDFTIGQPETDTLGAGASTTFPVTFTPAGPGERTGSLRIASTDTFSPPREITLVGKPVEGLEAWRFTHFGSLLDEGPGANLNDPDHDGIVNLIEYATSSDPGAPSASPGQLTVSGDTMEYTFTRPSDAGNFLHYDLEWTTFPEWVWGPALVPMIVLSDDGTRQKVKCIFPVGDRGRRFLRLRVEVL